jgi:beta-mannosidase
MQSHPSLALFESVLPEQERFPESRTVQWHNKAGSASGPDGHRRLAVYLADNLRVGPTLAEHVYATQFVQAEAMRVAYQDFRRRWQQPGARAVGGALVWQLNDCWPVTSWALIDSAGTPKPAWHAVRRALAPLAVAVRLEPGQATLAVMNGGMADCRGPAVARLRHGWAPACRCGRGLERRGVDQRRDGRGASRVRRTGRCRTVRAGPPERP